MTRPSRNADLDTWLWYLINRLDEHLRDHSKAQDELLRVRRQSAFQLATLVITALAALASLVSVLLVHAG